MKEEILSNLDNPAQLERLYRQDKAGFKLALDALYPSLKENNLIRFWNERLNYEIEPVSQAGNRDFLWVMLSAAIAGVLVKLPAIFGIDEEFYYSRNTGFIVFPLLMAYFAWKNRLTPLQWAFIGGATLLSALFINLFPDNPNSDTLTLSCIHLILFLWSVTGFAFVGEFKNHFDKRLGFLKYNGDLLVMSALILIAGGILSGITIGLFSLIGLQIERLYFEYVVLIGLAAVPVVATYLIRNNPQLVGKVSPVIARIFSPLVLVMLIVYLSAMIYSGKNPYNDREFLLIFNLMLIGVMAIIFFSVAETSYQKSRLEMIILFLLSIVTIIVNGIALSAILIRISEGGFTPNRTALMGGNMLILINLVLVAIQLFRCVRQLQKPESVGNWIALYLPVYFVWAAVVAFLFPFIFGFR